MKDLQNNYTTPEQSKRLLAIKLPQNTADMYYNKEYPLQPILPCWSAGRLIELSFLVRDLPSVSLSNYSGEGLVEMIVQHFEVFAKNVDWSKLQ